MASINDFRGGGEERGGGRFWSVAEIRHSTTFQLRVPVEENKKERALHRGRGVSGDFGRRGNTREERSFCDLRWAVKQGGNRLAGYCKSRSREITFRKKKEGRALGKSIRHKLVEKKRSHERKKEKPDLGEELEKERLTNGGRHENHRPPKRGILILLGGEAWTHQRLKGRKRELKTPIPKKAHRR